MYIIFICIVYSLHINLRVLKIRICDIIIVGHISTLLLCAYSKTLETLYIVKEQREKGRG